MINYNVKEFAQINISHQKLFEEFHVEFAPLIEKEIAQFNSHSDSNCHINDQKTLFGILLKHFDGKAEQAIQPCL